MENVTKFAAEAERFESWAHDATDEGEWAAVNEALLRIASLYLAALHYRHGGAMNFLRMPSHGASVTASCAQ